MCNENSDEINNNVPMFTYQMSHHKSMISTRNSSSKYSKCLQNKDIHTQKCLQNPALILLLKTCIYKYPE